MKGLPPQWWEGVGGGAPTPAAGLLGTRQEADKPIIISNIPGVVVVNYTRVKWHHRHCRQAGMKMLGSGRHTCICQKQQRKRKHRTCEKGEGRGGKNRARVARHFQGQREGGGGGTMVCGVKATPPPVRKHEGVTGERGGTTWG